MAAVNNNSGVNSRDNLYLSLANYSKIKKPTQKQADRINPLLKQAQGVVNAGMAARMFRDRPSPSAGSTPVATGSSMIGKLAETKAPEVTANKNQGRTPVNINKNPGQRVNTFRG
jgi:hypothetical protein